VTNQQSTVDSQWSAVLSDVFSFPFGTLKNDERSTATLEDILVLFTFLNGKIGNSVFSLVKNGASLYFT